METSISKNLLRHSDEVGFHMFFHGFTCDAPGHLTSSCQFEMVHYVQTEEETEDFYK